MGSLRDIAGVGLVVLLLGVAGAAWAQGYPSKPVRLILGFAPGGLNDIMARIVSEKLTAALSQPIVVENRVGAGGTIGAAAAARSAPDGYTLFLGSVSNIAIAPSQYKHLQYDPANDFEPITRAGAAVSVLVVNSNFPVSSVKDLIALAKRQPGTLAYASGGQGTSTHLGPELFNTQAGIKLLHVPYKGDGPGIADVMAGHIPIMFPTLPAASHHIKSGKVRALAVLSATRTALLPDVPTAGESGVPDCDVSVWVGILAPAGTPKEIVNKLNTEIVKILRQSEVRARLAELGLEAVEDTPEQFSAFIKAEISKWSMVSKAAGVTPID